MLPFTETIHNSSLHHFITHHDHFFLLSLVCCLFSLRCLFSLLSTLLSLVSSVLQWIQREIAAFGGDPSQVRREKKRVPFSSFSLLVLPRSSAHLLILCLSSSFFPICPINPSHEPLTRTPQTTLSGDSLRPEQRGVQHLHVERVAGRQRALPQGHPRVRAVHSR